MKIPQTYFEKLRIIISLTLMKQETSEPELQTIDSMSYECGRISAVLQYAIDIDRILKELQLSLSLIREIPDENFLKKHSTTLEDYIMYQQGYSLDLIHQLKDKLGHFVDGITTQGQFQERERLNILRLASEEKVSKITGLTELLQEWNQEGDRGIGVALRKRIQYHHFRNRLPLHEKYLDIKFARTLEQSKGLLTEEGVKMIEDRGKQGMADWHTDVIEKVESTIRLIEENIEGVSRVLAEGLDLPDIEKDAEKITQGYYEMNESLRIKNIAKGEIIPPFLAIVREIVSAFREIQKDNLLSLYLVGSVTRGDAHLHHSDINLIAVIEKEDSSLFFEIQDFIRRIYRDSGITTTLDIVTKEDFFNDENAKLRFICKTDGLLLIGDDLIRSEKTLKPGLRLAFLLNKDAENKFQSIKNYLAQNPKLPQQEISKIAKDLSKMHIRVMFAEVMSNKAIYERNIIKMADAIIEHHPKGAKGIRLTQKIATGEGTVDRESLESLVAAFEDKLIPLLKQIESKNKELDNVKKKP